MGNTVQLKILSVTYDFGKEGAKHTHPREKTFRGSFIDNEEALDNKPVKNRLYPGILLWYRSVLN